MGRPVYAVVDLEAIAGNVKGVRARVGPSVKIMAVVKADAYGHGAVEVSRAALEAGADWLGVAIPEEGAELRRAGLQAPILVLGPTPPDQADLVAAFDLDQTLPSLQLAQALSRSASERGRRIGVHLKVDTGMGRIGVPPSEAVAFAKRILLLPGLDLRGLMTHLATADEADKTHALAQLKLLREVDEALRREGIQGLLRHAANSAAVLDLPEAFLDLVRPGIMLYGYYPSKAVSHSVPLRPALSFIAQVAYLKEVPEGTGISYGRTFVALKPLKVATLPLGYADGYSRLLSNRGEVLIRGRRAKVIGRVCMDMVMVDVTDIPGVEVGDEAVIYGRQGEEAISVDEVAEGLGTISYELLSLISKRVPRIYVHRIPP